MFCKKNKKREPNPFSILFYLIAFCLFVHVLLPYTSKTSIRWFFLADRDGLTKTEYTLTIGEKCTLKVNAKNVRVSYSTSDFKVASVNQNGTVYAKRTGVAIISAAFQGKKFQCRIKVVDP